MEELDRLDWDKFRLEVRTSLNAKNFELVCRLHAKYYKHRYYKPCTCNPNTIKRWIAQLNDVYEKN